MIRYVVITTLLILGMPLQANPDLSSFVDRNYALSALVDPEDFDKIDEAFEAFDFEATFDRFVENNSDLADAAEIAASYFPNGKVDFDMADFLIDERQAIAELTIPLGSNEGPIRLVAAYLLRVMPAGLVGHTMLNMLESEEGVSAYYSNVMAMGDLDGHYYRRPAAASVLYLFGINLPADVQQRLLKFTDEFLSFWHGTRETSPFYREHHIGLMHRNWPSLERTANILQALAQKLKNEQAHNLTSANAKPPRYVSLLPGHSGFWQEQDNSIAVPLKFEPIRVLDTFRIVVTSLDWHRVELPHEGPAAFALVKRREVVER